MKTYKTQAEFEKEIKGGVFASDESIDISAFSLEVVADIRVDGNIIAHDIIAGNIRAYNISAHDISAHDIGAHDISACNIEYYAVAFAYQNIKAKSIVGRRKNNRHFVLDGTIEIEKA
ncbi:MAG: hypothetical protein HY376_03945 [Candidatus Blackburnbacteria bacterium]|nr:hypothetical protein [Candidatus Blackburnbacteria bacterium]